MRHRKVLNLYDTDPGHEQLLIYLEGIEGSTRQSQALLQMAMVGYRVMALHESGEEAYLRVRNPDISALTKPTRRQAITRAIEHSRSEPITDEPVKPNEHPARPAKPASRPSPALNVAQSEVAHAKAPMAPPKRPDQTATPPRRVAEDLEHVAHEDLNEEFNTLKILQRMGEAD